MEWWFIFAGSLKYLLKELKDCSSGAGPSDYLKFGVVSLRSAM